MPSFFKSPTFIITVIAIVFGGGIYFYNSYKQKQNTSTTTSDTANTTTLVDLTNTDPADFTAELKTELALADSKAKEYNAAEALSAVEVSLPGSLAPRSGSTVYIYDQPKDATYHFTINISQATPNFVRAIIPKADYFGTLTTINLNSWKLSYIEALKVAEKNGGSEWRQKNVLSEMKLTLKNGNPKGWLYWVVHYVSGNNVLDLQVDAFSGRFVPASEIESATTTATTSQSTP